MINKRWTITRHKYIYILYWILLFAVVLTDNSFVGLAFCLTWLILASGEEAYVTIPALSIFCNELVIPFVGIGLFRYGIAYMLVIQLIRRKRTGLSKSVLLQMFICFLYISTILYFEKGMSMLMYFLPIIYIAQMWNSIQGQEQCAKKLFRSFVITILISITVGLLSNSYSSIVAKIGAGYMNQTRFYATFNDPNYAAMFINAAIFMCICTELFSTWLQRIILVVLYIGVIMTASMTGIICNILVIFSISCMKYGFKPKVIITSLKVLGVIIAIYFIGLNLNVEILHVITNRVHLKFMALFEENNLSAFTSGRTSLTQAHWEYFCNNGTIFNWLFGGIPTTALYCTPEIGGAAAHLEYLDLFLNIGVVGTVIYLGCILIRFKATLHKVIKNRKNQNTLDVAKAALFINYLICGLSLTMFMEPQFFLWVFM